MLQADFISALKFVSVVLPKGDAPAGIAGAYLEFNEGDTIHLTATDGWRLHTVTLSHVHGQPEGAFRVADASVKAWLTAKRPPRSAKTPLDLTAPCGVPMLHEMPANVIPGEYADYRRTLPLGPTAHTETLLFSCDYLADSVSAFKYLGGSGCRVDMFGPNHRILIKRASLDKPAILDATCLVMPLRDHPK